ncbi:hypothetical protein LTR85_009209 [Meristemomyces frigidus]|nr:hypothetical protein LTR85_009209 [Meristemomyces frigidus]
MPKGSCVCGEYTHEYTGEPIGVAVCHCIPCRKTAGSNGSTNNLIKADQYKKTSGSVRNWTRKGDSGKDVTYNNCATCGTIMSVNAAAMPDVVILKNGTLDGDAEDACKPGMEIYTKNRPTCFDAIPGAAQKETS